MRLISSHIGVIVLFLAGCQPFSFDDPKAKQTCLTYLEGPSIRPADEVRKEEEEGYLQPMFYPNRENQIIFVHRVDDQNWKIMHLDMTDGDAVNLVDSQRELSDYDMNEQEALLWVESPGELFLRQPSEATKQVPFSTQILGAKWANSNIVVLTVDDNIVLIDTMGNALEELPIFADDKWQLRAGSFGWSVSNDVLMLPYIHSHNRKQALFIYQLPGFQLVGTLDITAYGSLDEGSLAVSANGFSFDFIYPDKVILSRPNRIYAIDIQSQIETIIWEREQCLVTETGIALSPNGDALISGCSRLVKSPVNSNRSFVVKELGLMLLQDGFSTLTTSYP